MATTEEMLSLSRLFMAKVRSLQLEIKSNLATGTSR
jgi:hypothetical protein